MAGPETTDPSAEAIIGLYQRVTPRFDAQRSRTLFEKAWLDRFLALLPPAPQVLDLGCGMGEPIAAHLIDAGCRITGVDSAPQMLALARARFPAHQWVEADMRGLDLGQRFDGILAWNSFFHLSRDDQRRMFPSFAAHAAPGAPLMFTCGPDNGEALGEMAGEPLYHASLARDEYEALMAASGFAPDSFVAEDPDCAGHSIWLAQRH